MVKIEAMNWDYDVIVVGAGPGGCAAARSCARTGLKTLLIEKERLPRYKPCGGCLSLKAVRLLDFDLTPVLENTVYGAKFTYCLKDPFYYRSDHPVAFLVMRDRFDQFLLEKASGEGAEVLEGERVSEVRERDGGVEVECAKGRRLSCEYLIGADGPGSTVARAVDLPETKGRGIGLESEVPLGLAVNFPEEEFRLIHLDFGGVPNGYAWVFPKREGLSIGMGGMLLEKEKVKLRRCFSAFVKKLSYLDESKAVPVLGHLLPSFYEAGQRVSRGRVLLVGDAAHLMDPLMGEGIYYALRSGMLAAEAIGESRRNGGSPSGLYQDAVNYHISGNLKWALGFSRFVFRFNKLAYRSLKRYPELADFYLGVLEGTEDYQGFLKKVKERMKDVLKGRLGEKIRSAMGRT